MDASGRSDDQAREQVAPEVTRPRPKYRVPELDLLVSYRHPEATADLIIPVNLVCNTPDEVLIANVLANSALAREWVSTVPAHDGVALICGSGPSLEDDINVIRAMEIAGSGGTIFAMNGAAAFLARHGIHPHYQVIADAREQTGDLIGPACNHIFANQVHPSLFDRCPNAKLLHVKTHESMDEFYELIAEFGKPQLVVGSSGSVGNVSLSLAYAMGFRNIHVFGFDSSFRGDAGHAFSQPMNISEPVCKVEYAGKTYQCTFTMKSQADVFPRLAYELEQMGVTFTVHGTGFLQDRWNGERAKTLEQREADKYRLMWEQPSYRDYIPCVDHIDTAIERLGIKRGDSLIDFGCGAGQATLAFRDKGVRSMGYDIAAQEALAGVDGWDGGFFFEVVLWHLPPFIVDVGFCVDVMEHIPPEKVDEVLAGIARSVKRGAYFAIDSVPDRQGLIIGQPLHMTVRVPAWWAEQLLKHFARVDQYDGGVFVCFHDIPEQRRD